MKYQIFEIEQFQMYFTSKVHEYSGFNKMKREADMAVLKYIEVSIKQWINASAIHYINCC